MTTKELTLSRNTSALVVAPQNFTEVLAFANEMAKSLFVPKHLRNRPADCLAVCLQALRWEMDPFSVAQKTYFVSEGSPPGYEAQLIAAVIYARAPLEGRLHIEWTGEGPSLECSVTGKIIGDPRPKVKKARLSAIATKNSPLWKTDPEQQLAYYTTRAWARLYCPDVIMGVYAPEEINAGEMIDVSPEQPSHDPLMDGELVTPAEETSAEITQPPTNDRQEPSDMADLCTLRDHARCGSDAFRGFLKANKRMLDVYKRHAEELDALRADADRLLDENME